MVGSILCLVYGLGYFHGKAVDKTVISKSILKKRMSHKNLANPEDKKSEISQPDEVNKVNLSNQDFEKNSTSPFGSYFHKRS